MRHENLVPVQRMLHAPHITIKNLLALHIIFVASIAFYLQSPTSRLTGISFGCIWSISFSLPVIIHYLGRRILFSRETLIAVGKRRKWHPRLIFLTTFFPISIVFLFLSWSTSDELVYRSGASVVSKILSVIASGWLGGVVAISLTARNRLTLYFTDGLVLDFNKLQWKDVEVHQEAPGSQSFSIYFDYLPDLTIDVDENLRRFFQQQVEASEQSC